MDPTVLTSANLTLATIVFALGVWGYCAVRRRSALYVGIAFGLFALTHLFTLLQLAKPLEAPILVIRIAAYLMAAYAIIIIALKRKNA